MRGQQFGQLTALRESGRDERGYRLWLCRCTCGKLKKTRESHLLSSTVKSCGCAQYACRNMHIGDKYGRLVAVKNLGLLCPNKGYTWLFKCDCGKDFKTYAFRVKAGLVKSCGCLRSENALKQGRLRRVPGLGALTQYFHVYRIRAIKREIPFAISREDFAKITSKPCVYCGQPPRQVVRFYSHKTDCRSTCFANGIDRLDSSIGYIAGNVVPCCTKCNQAKNTMTVAEFRAWIEKVYRQRMQWSGI